VSAARSVQHVPGGPAANAQAGEGHRRPRALVALPGQHERDGGEHDPREAAKRSSADPTYQAGSPGTSSTPAAVMASGIEAAGLAKRRPHPTDRRARTVALTPKGRRVLERARRMSAQVEDEVLHGLTAAERRELLTLLRRALDSAPPQPLSRAEEGD
jgi:hypothetical protein